MESLVSPTSTASRDILSEELTSLRALLRLNADGIGDEADLFQQLNQTRAAIDQFCAVLSERRDLLVTPDSLPSTSPVSSITTSPRLSLESIPSWRSSRTSQLSLSIEGEIMKSFVLESARGRPTERRKSRMIGGGSIEEWNLEVESPQQGEEETEHEDEDNNMENGGEEEGEEQDDLEEDEGSDPQDAAFKRLSTLLASLQAQAEAVLSNPTSPIQEDGMVDFGDEESEDLQHGVSQFPTTHSHLRARKRASAYDSENLLRATFRRTLSLPQVSSNRTLEKSAAAGITSTILGPTTTGEVTPSSPSHTHFPLPGTLETNENPPVHVRDGNPGPLHRRTTSASLYSSPKRFLRTPMGSPPLSGISTLPSTACSSRRSSLAPLSRRSSSLMRDMGLEALIGDLIETANMANSRVEEEGFMPWVWALLGGGALVWFMVGWTLRWNCSCACEV